MKNKFIKNLPQSGKHLLTNDEIRESLPSIIGKKFILTGKPRTDGVRLQKMIRKLLRITDNRTACEERWSRSKGLPSIGEELLYVYLATPPYRNDSYNLQMWNVNIHDLHQPLVQDELGNTIYKLHDARVLVVWADRELDCIQDATLLSIEELIEAYSPTKTRTLKRQAMIPKNFRHNKATKKSSVSELVHMTNRNQEVDVQNYDEIIKSAKKELFKEVPKKESLLSIKFLAQLLLVLKGKRIEATDVRTMSQKAERLVLDSIGYNIEKSTKLVGSFPDVPHQLLEVKLQTKQTMSLGEFTPYKKKQIPLLPFATTDIRYCVLFIDEEGVIEDIFLMSSKEFKNNIPQVKSESYKIQLRIPVQDSRFNGRRKGSQKQLAFF